jgi:hypothetical protein
MAPVDQRNWERGNELGLVHGAESQRVITKRALRIKKRLYTSAPWLDSPEFEPAVNRYLQTAAREALLHEHVVKITREKGTQDVPARMHEAATAAARLSAKLADDLGLSPGGKATLQLLTAAAAEAESVLNRVGRVEFYTEDQAGSMVAQGIKGILTRLGLDPDTKTVRDAVREELRSLDQPAIEASAVEIR